MPEPSPPRRSSAPWLLLVSALIVLAIALPALRRRDTPRPVPPPAPAPRLEVERQGGLSRLRLDAGPPLRETEAEIEDPRLVALPGGGRVAVWDERRPAGARPWYALDPDGQGFRRARAGGRELLLRRGAFTVEQAAGPLPGPLPAAAGELHLVQFVCPPTAAMRAALEALGARVHQPVPHAARVVRMGPEVASAVAALEFVRWVGPYRPDFRVEPAVLERLERGTLEAARYHVQVLERGAAQQESVAARVRQLGGAVEALVPEGFRLDVTLAPAQLAALAQLDEVLWIDRWSPPEADLSLVRSVAGADYVEALTGFSGEGVRAEIMDDNVRATHLAFQSDPILFHGARSGDGDHGTKTTGCLFGDGTGLPSARGLLPDAQPIFADYHHLSNRYAHTASLLQAPFQAVLQSNSWGTAQTTAYTSTSAELDDILFLNDLVLVQSQSNTGSQLSRPQAWAKNALSVGAVRHFNSPSLLDDTWSGTGSIGPAADGRVKPDLCFWYDTIQTTDDDSDTDYTSSFSGTSAATPCVAGYVGLAQQMWSEGLFGNAPVGATVFERRAHAATVRALLVNTARRYDFTGAAHDLTRTHQGWGLPDARSLFDLRDRLFVVDEEHVLGELETRSYALTVPGGTPAFRATLAWTDLPGTPSAALHRVNDLSLHVVAPDGKSYWGNHGLLEGNVSVPGGSPNAVDVIENVFVLDPAPGTWLVEVSADELGGDGHPETPAVDADFALVVSGVLRPGDCAPPAAYCQAKPTSLGTLPSIGAQGSPSVSGGAFAVTLSGGVPHQPAVAFRGPEAASTPFLGGTLCVTGGLTRSATADLDAGGAGVFPVDLSGRTPGSTERFQVWFRDPLDPAGFGVGLSDALEVVYCQ